MSYAKRFIHLLDGMPVLGGIMRTKYNQYHSVVILLQRYLQQHGVNFKMQTQVIDIDFSFEGAAKTATAIHAIDESGKQLGIPLKKMITSLLPMTDYQYLMRVLRNHRVTR